MTSKRFERVADPAIVAPLVFGDGVGTARFERVADPAIVVVLAMSRPDVTTLEIEFDAATAADQIETVKKLCPLFAAVDRLERSFGGSGLDVGEVTHAGPMVTMVLRPVQADGAAERLARVRAAVDAAVPPGFRVRRAG